MIVLSYDGLPITVNHIFLFKKQAVYSGPTYTTSRIVLGIEGYYNPSLNSFSSGRPNPVVPLLPQGHLPPVVGVPPYLTDIALRHRLLQPRKLLLVTIGGITWLRSPLLATYITDAANGPTPIDADVVQVHGFKT